RLDCVHGVRLAARHQAEQVLDLLGNGHRAGVEIQVPDAHVGRVQGQPQLLPFLAQSAVHRLALGDVDDLRDDVFDVAGGAAGHADGQITPAHAAVRQQVALFQPVEVYLAAQHALKHAQIPGPVI